jgi:hypothetical protein
MSLTHNPFGFQTSDAVFSYVSSQNLSDIKKNTGNCTVLNLPSSVTLNAVTALEEEDGSAMMIPQGSIVERVDVIVNKDVSNNVSFGLGYIDSTLTAQNDIAASAVRVNGQTAIDGATLNGRKKLSYRFASPILGEVRKVSPSILLTAGSLSKGDLTFVYHWF